MELTSCPKCGTELPEDMNTCYVCGCTYDNEDDEWDDEYDDYEADQEVDMDFLSVVKYLDILAEVYGWDTVWKIWEKTEGFVANVEDVISNYPKKADVPDEGIKRCMWILRAYKDSDTILVNIQEACDAERWDDASMDDITEDEFDAFGYVCTREEMRERLQEQRWIDVENACLYERVEATLQK
jgi:hypothetical protein